MEFDVRCRLTLVEKLQLRTFLGIMKPRLSSMSFGVRIFWKFTPRLLENEGFRPAFPIEMFRGLVSS